MNVSRLFYPILFTVTAALAATLWVRNGLSTRWLDVLDAAVAQAQSPPGFEPVPPRAGGPAAAAPRGGSAPPSGSAGAQPPWNGTANGSAPTAQRLPPTAQPADTPPPGAMSRGRAAPYTQLRLDPLGMKITQPVPVSSARVVGGVGNEIILAADVLPQVNEEFQQTARQFAPEQHAQYFEMLMAKYVKQLVQFKLVVREAKDGLPDDKLPEIKKGVMSHFSKAALPGLLEHWKVKTETELDAKLKEHGSSVAKEKERWFEQYLASEWMRKEIKFDEHVSHEELLKYYHEHLAQYEFKAKVRFEEIRVSYGKKRTKQEAWAAIRQLADRVYAGASMTELAKAHSDGLKAENGGLHDWTNQGSLSCQEIDKALFSLPVGVLSNIIDDTKPRASTDKKGDSGAFVLVRVVEKTEAGITRFEEAQAGIRETIKAQRKKAAQDKKFADFMEKNKFRAWTIYDDMLREAEEKAKNAGTKQNKTCRPGTKLKFIR